MPKLIRLLGVCITLLLTASLYGCAEPESKTPRPEPVQQSPAEVPKPAEPVAAQQSKDTTDEISSADTSGTADTSGSAGTSGENTSRENTSAGEPLKKPLEGIVLCIDPGHQTHGEADTEPIAPSSRVLKARVTGGTQGIETKLPEYRLNLQVSLKIQKLLEGKGAQVVMTRTIDQVSLSNVERARIGNEAGALLVVRIHADSSQNTATHGISVLYPSAEFVPDAGIVEESKLAAGKVLDAVLKSTGAGSRGLVERKDLTGFNWSTVPVILVEMGFMSNPEEDRLLGTGSYQDKLAAGIVSGIEDYIADYHIDNQR